MTAISDRIFDWHLHFSIHPVSGDFRHLVLSKIAWLTTGLQTSVAIYRFVYSVNILLLKNSFIPLFWKGYIWSSNYTSHFACLANPSFAKRLKKSRISLYFILIMWIFKKWSIIYHFVFLKICSLNPEWVKELKNKLQFES